MIPLLRPMYLDYYRRAGSLAKAGFVRRSLVNGDGCFWIDQLTGLGIIHGKICGCGLRSRDSPQKKDDES